MTYSLVIFDFDGTLADSASWFVTALNKAAVRFGFPVLSDAEVERLRGQGNREIIRHLGVPLWKIPRIATYIRRLAAEDAGSIRLFPDAGDTLRRLRAAGVRIAIASSNAEGTIRQVLGAENAALIDAYECGASLFGKAARFRRVMRRTGMTGPAVIAIGDEARDIEAARAAGVAAGAAAWGYATADLLRACQPDALFASLSDVAAMLTASAPLAMAEG